MDDVTEHAGSPATLLIVGTGFSGSTLLSLLLNAHPEIISVGEAQGPFLQGGDPAAYTCSCGKALGECPFWERVSEAMSARGIEFGPAHWDMMFDLSDRPLANHVLTRSLRNNHVDALRDHVVGAVPAWGGRLREVARRNEALFQSLALVSGARAVVDASKDPYRAWHLERLTDLRPHVLHLVRDAPGFVASFMSHKSAPLLAGVRTWNRMVDHVERLFGRLPEERRVRLRYEDLCAEPGAELARVAARLGVGVPADWPFEYDAARHHVIGNRMRLARTSDIRLDERWRERLSQPELERVLEATAEGRSRYGYA